MFRLVFIGGSIDSIAGYPHFIASQMDKKFEVIGGVFSTDAKINEETAKEWRVPKVYNDYKELLKDKKSFDALVILTPTPHHYEVLKEALIQKIPVICEKPLVNSLQATQELNTLLQKDNFLVVTNNYSGYPMVRELQHKIKNKELGDILSIRLKMPQESFLRPPKSVKYPQKWRLKDDFIPMISLDLGSHLHHLSYFLLGEEPTEIMAQYSHFSKYDVVDDVDMLLKYPSGISGNLWLSKTALGNRNGLHIEIYGTKASASWHQETPEQLEFSYSSGQKVIIDRGSDVEMIANPLYNRMTPGHPAGFIESFANLYNDIANALENFFDKKPYLNDYVYGFEHASNGIILLHCASLSHNKSKYIKISDTSKND